MSDDDFAERFSLLHNAVIQKFVQKIEYSKITEKDEWSKGLNTGLDWAIRVITGDKSAS
jgi:hypothetical protein